MHAFVASLLERGVVTAREADESTLDDAIDELDRAARREAPGECPDLDRPAAGWGVRLLHAACTLLVERRRGAEEVQQTLGAAAPGPGTAEGIFGVDLALRYLPDLHGLARRVAADDPLVVAVAALGARWPLSSVGISLPEDVQLAERQSTGQWNPPWNRRAPPSERVRRRTQAVHSSEATAGYDIDYEVDPDAPWPED